jgi:subtilisin family serine protease
VSAEGLESQRRQVTVRPEGQTEIVVLGRPGLPFYHRGSVKVPYEALPYIGVSFVSSTAVEQRVAEIAARYQVESVKAAPADAGVGVFRAPAGLDPGRHAQLAAEISQADGVEHAGPAVALHDTGVAFLTNEFVVKFQPTVGSDDAARLMGDAGLVVRQAIPYARNAFLVEARDASAGLAACNTLVESGRVVYAEPNLVATADDDAINPSDTLFPQQWHLQTVRLPEAWEELRLLNALGVTAGNPGDLTFGSETITIAIVDRGIPSQTVGGVVQQLHPDFNGTVTSGAPKISVYFDFNARVANNDNTVDSHGVGCAGIAAALAENPSGVPGEAEGVVGAAPNCRVIAIIRGGTEKRYSDAYIWMAGLDPGATDPWFPALLPAGTGADVISSSFGLLGKKGHPLPMSGLMQDCFDTLTIQGRGGKGVVLCFSVGDNPFVDVQLQRPWAANDKTIGVAATTDADVRAPFSAFGLDIDICAPGGSGLKDLVTCELPGAGQLLGNTVPGATQDYTPFFNGTSASTPLVAGIAALVLSANPSLTWSEVRDILCDTAVKIDTGTLAAQWLDNDGDGKVDHSHWYGYGRVDARAAVIKACPAERRPIAPANVRILSSNERDPRPPVTIT